MALLIDRCTVGNSKQLGAVVAELIRSGSSSKDKMLRKQCWIGIESILKRFEPKKKGDGGSSAKKKPPKAILDALETGLKKGLSDKDKAVCVFC